MVFEMDKTTASFNTECGFKWFAPIIHPGGTEGTVEVACHLPQGHKGDNHMSWTKVTTPQSSDQKERAK